MQINVGDWIKYSTDSGQRFFQCAQVDSIDLESKRFSCKISETFGCYLTGPLNLAQKISEEEAFIMMLEKQM